MAVVTNTYTTPDDITVQLGEFCSWIISEECWGGGGAGFDGTGAVGGPGGASGSYNRSGGFTITPNADIRVIIGVGGVHNNATAPGYSRISDPQNGVTCKSFPGGNAAGSAIKGDANDGTGDVFNDEQQLGQAGGTRGTVAGGSGAVSGANSTVAIPGNNGTTTTPGAGVTGPVGNSGLAGAATQAAAASTGAGSGGSGGGTLANGADGRPGKCVLKSINNLADLLSATINAAGASLTVVWRLDTESWLAAATSNAVPTLAGTSSPTAVYASQSRSTTDLTMVYTIDKVYQGDTFAISANQNDVTETTNYPLGNVAISGNAVTNNSNQGRYAAQSSGIFKLFTRLFGRLF